TLSKQSPYSIQIIEEKSKLYGRDEILEELQLNIQSHNIESYKIWGQKRVGKSSIVKTLKSIFNKSEQVLIIYRSILGLRNPDPIRTLNDLGESICSEILTEIENKIKSPNLRDQLKNIPIPIFSGSFYPLEKFISKLHSISSDLKFIFIIDEFDRINEDFFKASDLGEGFSGSIGKALNEYKYIGFILVGSENMQLLDRQGMNYNSYLEREVDTFKKKTQYSSFKNIVLGPVNPHISFSEEAIERIFEVTNGNPYFTNLICKEAFKIAYKNRDSFIDIHLINDAIDLIVKSSQKSHFEHFWGDGLAEESDARKDRTTDIRRRILVSYSINSKTDANHYPTKSDIFKKFKYPEEYSIERYEVENTITEFFNRKIFSEKHNSVRINPSLFESWLCGPGKTLMIEGVADLEALHREIELEQEFSLKDEELLRLSETLEYQGRNITIEKLKDYFKQFGSSIQQRKVFKLLDSIFYISKEEVNDFFRKEHKNIFSKHALELKSNIRTPYREGIELYCFDSTIHENHLITDSFKVLNLIRTTKTVKNIKTESEAWKRNNADEIIIIEPVIDETTNLISELMAFITDEIKQKNISIRLVTLLITTKAKTNLVKATSTLPNFKLIIYKEVEETKIKPFIQGTELFENADESNFAFAEVRKKFPMVNRDSSFLVLFGSICPSKSCPILWYRNS
ncbi:MAG: ATP-binding protein, partial [Nitrosopumilus sp.]|nr:ATP-binding protein [Nitrosopumilus sp.]